VLFSIIRELNAKGLTVMFVSHKLDEITEIADRITVMRDGRKIGTFKNEALDGAQLSELLSGECIVHKQDFVTPGEETVLEVEGLSNGRQYRDISFKLRRGEVLGVIGLLGSGRTELALSLFGMNRPETGEVRLEGRPVAFKSNRDAIRAGIAYVPEDRLSQGLVVDQNVEDNISVSVLDRLRTRLGLIQAKTRRQLTESWIGKLKIKSAQPLVPASAMSGGNQQKIVIGKWLSTEPRILILDQPTNGIDIAAKSAIYTIIRELAAGGMSIIIISDEVPEIYYNCPRALVMHHGRILKELDCTALSEAEFEREVAYGQ
jgi:simple sugar transport system ATP-binding protein